MIFNKDQEIYLLGTQLKSPRVSGRVAHHHQCSHVASYRWCWFLDAFCREAGANVSVSSITSSYPPSPPLRVSSLAPQTLYPPPPQTQTGGGVSNETTPSTSSWTRTKTKTKTNSKPNSLQNFSYFQYCIHMQFGCKCCFAFLTVLFGIQKSIKTSSLFIVHENTITDGDIEVICSLSIGGVIRGDRSQHIHCDH